MNNAKVYLFISCCNLSKLAAYSINTNYIDSNKFNFLNCFSIYICNELCYHYYIN